MATQALSILVQQRLLSAVEHYSGRAALHVIPALCPLHVSVVDFSHTASLITRARVATLEWLDSGGADVAQPERFLSMHDHPESGGGASTTAVGSLGSDLTA